MTCIVGIVDKGTVYMGGDSAGVSGSDMSIRKDTKVFKNKEFLIGCTSSFRMIQLLRFSFNPPDIEKKDIYEYMCTDFIDGVRKCFKKGGYLQRYTKGDEKGGTFLVAVKGRLFRVEDDFQVGERARGFDSAGCGQSFAMGALHTIIDSDMSVKNKIIKALEVAEINSTGVSSPFVIDFIK